MNKVQSSRLHYPLAGEHHPPWCALAPATGVAGKSSEVSLPSSHAYTILPRIQRQCLYCSSPSLIFLPYEYLGNLGFCHYLCLRHGVLQCD